MNRDSLLWHYAAPLAGATGAAVLLMGIAVGRWSAGADRESLDLALAQRDSAVASAHAAGWALAELQAAATGPDDHVPAAPPCPSRTTCSSGY